MCCQAHILHKLILVCYSRENFLLIPKNNFFFFWGGEFRITLSHLILHLIRLWNQHSLVFYYPISEKEASNFHIFLYSAVFGDNKILCVCVYSYPGVYQVCFIFSYRTYIHTCSVLSTTAFSSLCQTERCVGGGGGGGGEENLFFVLFALKSSLALA